MVLANLSDGVVARSAGKIALSTRLPCACPVHATADQMVAGL